MTTTTIGRAVCSLALLTSACGGPGSATIEGEIAGHTFALSTIYAWVDATETKQEDGKWVFKPRDNRLLHIRFSGATFDPERDMRFLSTSDLLEMERQQAVNGQIGVTLTHAERLTGGQQITIGAMGADAPQLDVSFAFALKEVAPEATYPAEAPKFGTKKLANLTFSELNLAANGSVNGTLQVTIERDADKDAAAALTGSLKVEFGAPVINERIAECNASVSSNQLRGSERACEADRASVDVN